MSKLIWKKFYRNQLAILSHIRIFSCGSSSISHNIGLFVSNKFYMCIYVVVSVPMMMLMLFMQHAFENLCLYWHTKVSIRIVKTKFVYFSMAYKSFECAFMHSKCSKNGVDMSIVIVHAQVLYCNSPNKVINCNIAYKFIN